MTVIVHAESNQHVAGTEEFIKNGGLLKQDVDFDSLLKDGGDYYRSVEMEKTGERMLLFVGDSDETNEFIVNWVRENNATHYVTYALTTRSVIEKIIDLEVTTHIVRPGLTIHPYNGLSKTASECLEEITTHRDLENQLCKHRGGRPPLGTAVDDGHLVKGDNYQTVRRTLQKYIDGEILCEDAAKKLDTTTKTVSNASQRRELYQLETSEQVRDEKKGRLTSY